MITKMETTTIRRHTLERSTHTEATQTERKPTRWGPRVRSRGQRDYFSGGRLPAKLLSVQAWVPAFESVPSYHGSFHRRRDPWICGVLM